MQRLLAIISLLLLATARPSAAPAGATAGSIPTARPLVDHRLEVRIEPMSSLIRARDQIRLPTDALEWTLLLHAGLDPKVEAGEAELVSLGRVGHLARYGLRLRAPGPVTLTYGGRIRHALEEIQEGMGRARQWSRGTIQADGVFLDGSSGWYPRIPDRLQTFQLQVELPAGWTAVSQGAGPGKPGSGLSSWSESHPQDDIYLVAAPFRLYREQTAEFESQVYLRRPDEALAQGYLDATEDYVRLYSDLIGSYPYAKFALVENFWETGYGMPSFTLLGPKVIRLPFIVQTSYPHEILHNWWGNGVYVDYSSGNWSEGLTNYLADHWLRERAGQGSQYRRDLLKGYADYVRAGADFPLTEFRGRHGSASQAIGYGKGAMLFHMLRGRLGDANFRLGLRRFYADNQFRAASYADLRRAFETTTDQDLAAFFETWTTRPGAPRLVLRDVAATREDAGFQVRGRIEQTQAAAPYPLRVPVVIHQESGPPKVIRVESDARRTDFETDSRSAPLRVAVDPAFDVFRQLLPGETPVTLSNLFGSDEGLILVPTNAPRPLADAYRRLAANWKSGRPGWRVRDDTSVHRLPSDRPVWLLGWENRHLTTFAAEATGFALDPAAPRLRLRGEKLDLAGLSPVLTRWRERQPLAWMGSADASALSALARKLPHYGKYSYLVFSGPEARNQTKGQWPSGDSALVHWLGPRRELEPAMETPPLEVR